MAETFSYNSSYWEQRSFLQPADVLIIGSGIVGLSTALSLKDRQPDLRVVIAERGPMPIGASTRNAGFACFGSMTELLDDLAKHPASAVWALVERRWQGLQRLRERVGDQQLRYHNWGGFEVFTPAEEAIFAECVDHISDFNAVLQRITGQSETFRKVDEQIQTFGLRKVAHLLVNQAEGQIDTGQMMKGLLDQAREAGIEILTGLPIQALEAQSDEVLVQTAYGFHLSAKQVLVATNGFARQLLPELQVRPARNQVLITKPISRLKLQGCFHYDRGYYYFRNIDERILLGGGRNLTPEAEMTTELAQTSVIQHKLIQLLHEVIEPEAKVDGWWSGILGVADTKKPILQKVGPRITVAVRLGGMGVAIGSLLGEEAGEMIIG